MFHPYQIIGITAGKTANGQLAEWYQLLRVASPLCVMPSAGSIPDLAAMSKRRIGWYEDGCIKHSYFRRFKHYRIKRNGFRMIRWKMYVAVSEKLNKAFDMKEIRSKQFTNK